MLTAVEIGELIKLCAAHRVSKFEAGPDGCVILTFVGHREPLAVSAGSLEQMMPPEGDPWLSQVIHPAPLPPEVD